MADIITPLRTSDCHGMYLAGITRVERVLPLLPGSKVRLGDVLRLFGKPEDVARAAHLLGEAKAPDTVTGFVYLGEGLMVGILIGMVTVPLAGAALSLLPPLASLYIGRFLLHIEPAILRGAIAGQHAGYQCDRSRRRQPGSGDRLHRHLRDCEYSAATAGTHLCCRVCRHARDRAVDPRRLTCTADLADETEMEWQMKVRQCPVSTHSFSCSPQSFR